jgi:hypothetical protein
MGIQNTISCPTCRFSEMHAGLHAIIIYCQRANFADLIFDFKVAPGQGCFSWLFYESKVLISQYPSLHSQFNFHIFTQAHYILP